MRQFIYLLFFIIGFGQTVVAQETKRLEVSLMGTPFYLGIPWYQDQKDAWLAELNKDWRNEKAWDNYAFACFAMWKTEEDSSKQQGFEKELRAVVKKMKKYIPDTRAYYRYVLAQATDTREQERIHQETLSLKRTCERDYLDDMRYCYDTHQVEKIKEIAREWYKSGLFSSDLLSYCYNELSGLEKNAVLVSESNPSIFYRFLLQYGVGILKDIEIVSSVDLSNPEQGKWFWEKLGVDTKIFAGSEKVASGAEYFLEREKRLVYFSQFVYDKHLLESLKEHLYPEGLVFRYSLKPYHNLAVARKKYEQVYLLDYLRRPWSDSHVGISYTMNADWNYIVSFAPLLQFYRTSGDKNQYSKLKNLLQGILDRFRSGKVTTEYEEMWETVFARLKEMKEEGEIVIMTDRRDEYQQLLDGVEP